MSYFYTLNLFFAICPLITLNFFSTYLYQVIYLQLTFQHVLRYDKKPPHPRETYMVIGKYTNSSNGLTKVRINSGSLESGAAAVIVVARGHGEKA